MANAPTATSGSSNNNSKSPPTLSQVVALFYTYQRIVLVWGACPAVTVLLPFLTSSSLTILNCLTAGYGITSLLLSPLCLWTGYALIHSLARTRQSLEKALQTNQVRLPVGAFLLSVTVTRWVAGPLLAWWRLDAHRLSAISTSSSSSSTTTSSSSSYGSVPLVTALWCAWGMACAGLAVVARYIGPASVSKLRIDSPVVRDTMCACAWTSSLTLSLSLFSTIFLQCAARPFPCDPILWKRPYSTCCSIPGPFSNRVIHRENAWRRIATKTRADATNTCNCAPRALKRCLPLSLASCFP